MNPIRTEWPKYAIGMALTTAVLLGGGPGSGLGSDTIVQMIVFVLTVPVICFAQGPAINPRIKLFLAILSGIILFQLVPLPTSLLTLARSAPYLPPDWASGSSWQQISVGAGRTLDSFLYVATLISLFLAMLRLRGDQLHALVPFLLAALACQVLIGLIQYASAETIRIDGLLSFPIMAGLFGNRNHYASLLYANLPLLVYLGTFRNLRPYSVIAIIIILLTLLAAGSRAGVAIGMATLIVSLIFFAIRNRAGLFLAVLFISIGGAYAFGAWSLFERQGVDYELNRLLFAQTTWQGIQENGLFGVGFGTFPTAYQYLEKIDMIGREYVNHAHNDYLEIIFEGGLYILVLLIWYVFLLIERLGSIRHNNFLKSAYISILFVLIHSVVDYPLRTLAVSSIFIFFNAIIFHPDLVSVKRPHVKVLHNGRTIRMPIGT